MAVMPEVLYRQLFPAMWLAWVLYGCVSAIGVKAAVRREERWMAEAFGERYEEYRRRVPALIPSARRRRAA
jgi:protein-S-isoprenylcysteine O-methyltransferase Ste14